MKEEFIPNTGKGYKIREDGEVISFQSYSDPYNPYQRFRILSHRYNPGGYRVATIKINGKFKTISVHRLVAQAFLPNPENKPQVNHKDGNKNNPHVSNLEWVTQKENSLHSAKVLGNNIGEKNGQSKLDMHQVRWIKHGNHSLSCRKIGKLLGVSNVTISYVKRGIWWSDV